MWVIHEPGTCTAGHCQPYNNSQDSNKKELNAKAFTAHMHARGISKEEIESKNEAILAVMES